MCGVGGFRSNDWTWVGAAKGFEDKGGIISQAQAGRAGYGRHACNLLLENNYFDKGKNPCGPTILNGMDTRRMPVLICNTKCRCGPLEKPVLPE